MMMRKKLAAHPIIHRKSRGNPWFSRWTVCLWAAAFGGIPAGGHGEELSRSPASDTPAPGVVRTALPPDELEGLPLALVFYDLRGTSRIEGGDEQARDRIERAFRVRAGRSFDPLVVSIGVARVRNLEFVRQADYTVYESSRPGHLVLALSVVLGPGEDAADSPDPAPEREAAFPVLYRDEDTMLRLLLNGGIGFYTDVNPWFGNAPAFTSLNPVATSPAVDRTASWFESSVEYGLGGVRRVGSDDFWAYGAATYLTSFASGQDLFRSDTRNWTAIEDAYAGFVFQPSGSDWVVNASGGRQNWQLNDGFLFSQFASSANAGPLPGLFLSPRTAYEMTGLLKLHNKNLTLEGFYLDPNELIDSSTAFSGINVAYHSPGNWGGSFAYYEVPESNTTLAAGPGMRVPREGQQTANFRLTTNQLFGIEGLELSGESAYQTHRDVEWDAWAYYGRLGHSFRDLPWTPNLSYRYASFSGDDPTTPTYEGFDAPLSSGLDTWVQGINSRKVASNSNLDSHRIRLNVAPSPKLSLTLDYFWLLANEPAGGPREIGQEIDLGIRWAINPNLFFLGVVGVGFPDDQLRQRAGSSLEPWSTFQASLFWNF